MTWNPELRTRRIVSAARWRFETAARHQLDRPGVFAPGVGGRCRVALPPFLTHQGRRLAVGALNGALDLLSWR